MYGLYVSLFYIYVYNWALSTTFYILKLYSTFMGKIG